MSGPLAPEIFRSLSGAWMLFRMNTDGYRLFTVTLGGFWRSFGVFFLILPIYLFSLYVENRMVQESRPEAADQAANMDTYLIMALAVDWVAFPLLMAVLAGLMKLGHRYVPYIIAYNWSAAIIAAMMLPTLLLYLAGVMPAAAAMTINFGITLFMLFYRWFIARTALEINGATAAALVAIDFLLSMVIAVAATNLAQV